MCKFCKKLIKVLLAVTGVLFVVYFWNLDQKLLGWAYVRTAAVTEDAFITFRVIDNALHGHGLVWNVGERVQPYTHPLWALLLLAVSAVSGEIFHTSLGLSLALTLAMIRPWKKRIDTVENTRRLYLEYLAQALVNRRLDRRLLTQAAMLLLAKTALCSCFTRTMAEPFPKPRLN